MKIFEDLRKVLTDVICEKILIFFKDLKDYKFIFVFR